MSPRGRRIGGVLLLPALLALYLLLWPVSGDPASWDPPENPGLRGPYEVNGRLSAVERLPTPRGVPGEDVAVDAAGRVWTALLDGRVLRWPDRAAVGREEGPGSPAVVARTGGRPLGIAPNGAGGLWVADSRRGLLEVDSAGRVRVVADRAGDRPVRRANGVAVARDGRVYFTEASWRYPERTGSRDVLVGRPHGRLLSHDPSTGATTVLADSLWFANGVAPGPEPGTALVAETGRYRVRKVWTAGPRAGEWEIFTRNLPGFPDGVSWNGEGVWWIALVTPRSALLDWLWPRPFLRRILLRIPEPLRPEPSPHGIVLGLDGEGRVVHNLQDPTGRYGAVTNAVQEGGRLWIGSHREGALGRLPAPGTAGR